MNAGAALRKTFGSLLFSFLSAYFSLAITEGFAWAVNQRGGCYVICPHSRLKKFSTFVAGTGSECTVAIVHYSSRWDYPLCACAHLSLLASLDARSRVLYQGDHYCALRSDIESSLNAILAEQRRILPCQLFDEICGATSSWCAPTWQNLVPHLTWQLGNRV